MAAIGELVPVKTGQAVLGPCGSDVICCTFWKGNTPTALEIQTSQSLSVGLFIEAFGPIELKAGRAISFDR